MDERIFRDSFLLFENLVKTIDTTGSFPGKPLVGRYCDNFVPRIPPIVLNYRILSNSTNKYR